MAKAASFGPRGGWTHHPPISKSEAEDKFGHVISDDTWCEIKGAYDRYGMRMNELNGTQNNQNRNHKIGWLKRKHDAERGIAAALKGIQKIDRDFLSELDYMASSSRGGSAKRNSGSNSLERALNEIDQLSIIIRDAEPLSRKIATEAESRKMLACDLFRLLKPYGASTSNGWTLSSKTTSYADLTGFENLVKFLKIHQGNSPAAIAKWVREALENE